MNIFRTKTLFFVYAYLPPPEFKIDHEEISDSETELLKNNGFLNEDKGLTTKFFITTQVEFKTTLKGNGISEKNLISLYNKLAKRKFSDSTLAKMEVTQIAEKLRQFQTRFKFRICEIPNYL